MHRDKAGATYIERHRFWMWFDHVHELLLRKSNKDSKTSCYEDAVLLYVRCTRSIMLVVSRGCCPYIFACRCIVLYVHFGLQQLVSHFYSPSLRNRSVNSARNHEQKAHCGAASCCQLKNSKTRPSSMKSVAQRRPASVLFSSARCKEGKLDNQLCLVGSNAALSKSSAQCVQHCRTAARPASL